MSNYYNRLEIVKGKLLLCYVVWNNLSWNLLYGEKYEYYNYTTKLISIYLRWISYIQIKRDKYFLSNIVVASLLKSLQKITFFECRISALALQISKWYVRLFDLYLNANNKLTAFMYLLYWNNNKKFNDFSFVSWMPVIRSYVV